MHENAKNYNNIEATTFKLKKFYELHSVCRNPTLAKCGGEAQHFQSWGFGVLRDLLNV
jgi:hypothetical protein